VSRWSNLDFTLFDAWRLATHAIAVNIEIKTKSLLPVVLDSAHQALIDRIVGMYTDGLDTRKTSDHLNAEGVTSWTGKVFYPALVFGVIRKARLRAQARLMVRDQTVVSGTLVKLPRG
jgi:hypothetical protein